MIDAARHARNAAKLLELNVWFRPKVAAILRDLEGHGWRPRIQEAWRSQADQLAAYNAGRSKVKWGYHNATRPDGLPDALAADIVLDDHPYEEHREFLLKLYSSARAHGLETGAVFGISATARMRLMAAVSEARWDYDGPLGWDPWHVQPTPATLTIAQARAGKRPG